MLQAHCFIISFSHSFPEKKESNIVQSEMANKAGFFNRNKDKDEMINRMQTFSSSIPHIKISVN